MKLWDKASYLHQKQCTSNVYAWLRGISAAILDKANFGPSSTKGDGKMPWFGHKFTPEGNVVMFNPLVAGHQKGLGRDQQAEVYGTGAFFKRWFRSFINCTAKIETIYLSPKTIRYFNRKLILGGKYISYFTYWSA